MERASGEHFRFVLPGPEQSVARQDAMLAAIAAAIGEGAHLVVASGRLPPGVAPDFYGRVARLAREAGARLILDTSGPALKAALDHRPYCIRINHHEAGELLGRAGPVTADGARAAARDLVARGATELAIVTVGEEGRSSPRPTTASRCARRMSR